MLIIGFEQSSYTFFESFATFTQIPVIKGNNQLSELTFFIRISTVRRSDSSAANTDQGESFTNRDIIAAETQDRVFRPDQQSVPYVFELLDDSKPELLEVFQVELSAEESGLNINLGGPLPDGSTLFATTQICIVDDDG